MSPSPHQFLKISDFARITGLSTDAIRASIRRGEVPSVRIGKLFLIPRAHVDQLLAQAGLTQVQQGGSQ